MRSKGDAGGKLSSHRLRITGVAWTSGPARCPALCYPFSQTPSCSHVPVCDKPPTCHNYPFPRNSLPPVAVPSQKGFSSLLIATRGATRSISRNHCSPTRLFRRLATRQLALPSRITAQIHRAGPQPSSSPVETFVACDLFFTTASLSSRRCANRGVWLGDLDPDAHPAAGPCSTASLQRHMGLCRGLKFTRCASSAVA